MTSRTTALRRSATVRLHPGVYAALVMVIFIGSIGAAMAGGYWQTSGRTTGDGERVAPQGVTTSEIKGWMAIGDVAEAWQVPLADLLAQFSLPAETPATAALKDLESETFSVTLLRTWLSERAVPVSPGLTPDPG